MQQWKLSSIAENGAVWSSMYTQWAILVEFIFNTWNPRGQIHVDSTCLNWRHFKTPTIHQFSTNWS